MRGWIITSLILTVLFSTPDVIRRLLSLTRIVSKNKMELLAKIRNEHHENTRNVTPYVTAAVIFVGMLGSFIINLITEIKMIRAGGILTYIGILALVWSFKSTVSSTFKRKMVKAQQKINWNYNHAMYNYILHLLIYGSALAATYGVFEGVFK